jgi:ABC-type sugar transport system permease subunit
VISFQEHDGFAMHCWVGFDNYVETLTSKILVGREKHNDYCAHFYFCCIADLAVLALVLDSQSERIRRFFKAAILFPLFYL